MTDQFSLRGTTVPWLSWSQLRAFEACARLLNFTAAAAALGLTPAAVRYQVTLLEDRAGGLLFERNGGRLVLTAAGLAFARRIDRPMRELQSACQAIAVHSAEDPLTLTAPPMFARHFLFEPRFMKWCETNLVQLDVTDATRDLFARRQTVAIRMSARPETGLMVTPLLKVALILASSPEIAATAEPSSVSWWENQTVISSEVSERAWLAMWKAFRLPAIAPRRIQVSSYVAAMDAARQGRGLILAPLPFAQRDLEGGYLAQISDARLTIDEGYSILMHQDLARSATGRRLRRRIEALTRA